MKGIVIIVQSLQGIKKYDFDKDIISIGRSKENDIVLDDETVSSFHATLTFDPSLNQYILMDLNSRNGTFVEEINIKESYPIVKATPVKIGKNKLQIFPTEIKEGQKTVLFDIEDFKKSMPKEMLENLDEEKIPTIAIERIKKGQVHTIYKNKIKEKNDFLFEISFISGEHKGKNFKIEKDKKEILFGRSQNCDFAFKDQRISREHFKIKIEKDKLYISNLKPINPVYLNGQEITNQELMIGNNSIIKVQNEEIKINFIEKEKTKEEKIYEKPKELFIDIKDIKDKIKFYIIKGPLNIDYYYKLENLLLSNLSPDKKWAILDFRDISIIDYPALASLLKIIAEYNQIGGEIILINVSRELEKTFELVNVLRYINKFKKENYNEAMKYLENKIK